MRTLLILAIAAFSSFTHAQVKISSDGGNPDPSAGLELDFADRGFLPPRMTTAQRDEIQIPAQGLQIYNTTTKCVEIYIGTFWQNMFCGCEVAPSNLTYTNNGPLTYCLNAAIVPNIPVAEGNTPGFFSVSPVLPAGLNLNPVSGLISGTPVSLSEATNYTITASNACGFTSSALSIAVTAIPGAPASISGPSAPTLGLSAVYSTNAVSAATAYNWSVPAGWSIDSGQGTTSVTVTVGSVSGNVSVSAENNCGTSALVHKVVTPWRPVAATGGTVTTYTGNGSNGLNGVEYKLHAFNTTGALSWNVADTGTDAAADLLIVAGGGGGGGSTGSYEGGGGGGAGGLIQQTLSVLNGEHSVVVGAGGSGGAPDAFGSDGGNSSFADIVATGGGGGALGAPGLDYNGRPGGSGGGGTRAGFGGSGVSGQGNAGGNAGGSANSWGAGGGGGRSAVGQNAIGMNNGGAGGAGFNANSIFGNTYGAAGWFAGGGGAGGTNGLNGLLGGSGGGGTGGNYNVDGNAAVANTGGGGGGAGGNGRTGGNGGSGIVIIRYPITNPNPM